MRKQNKSMLVLAILTAFVVMAVFLPGMTLAFELQGIVMARALVEKTGQTESEATGDDGDLQKGVPWPNPRFTDHGDGTVTDKLTKLIWMKNANCFYLFGGRLWGPALDECNNLANGSCGLSDGSSAGDWRLPNVRELHSLISYGQCNDHALPVGHPFSDVQSRVYWSSTTDT